MIFDTDIFIWVQRGNIAAAQAIEGEGERLLSVQSYIELLQGDRWLECLLAGMMAG